MSQFGGQTKIEITADNKDAVAKLGATEKAFDQAARGVSQRALGAAAALGGILAAVDKLFVGFQQAQNAAGEFAKELSGIQGAIRGDVDTGNDAHGKRIQQIKERADAQRKAAQEEADNLNLIQAGVEALNDDATLRSKQAQIDAAERRALNEEVAREEEAQKKKRETDAATARSAAITEMLELRNAIEKTRREEEDKAAAEEEQRREKAHQNELKRIEEEREAREKAHTEAVKQFEELQAMQRQGFGVSSSLTGNAQLNALAQIQRVHRLRGGR